MTAPGADRIYEFLRLNPEATTPEVLGATDTDLVIWGDVVDDALTTDEPHLALETPDTGAPEGNFRDDNPTLEADKQASTTSDTPDTDGSALVAALECSTNSSTAISPTSVTTTRRATTTATGAGGTPTLSTRNFSGTRRRTTKTI